MRSWQKRCSCLTVCDLSSFHFISSSGVIRLINTRFSFPSLPSDASDCVSCVFARSCLSPVVHDLLSLSPNKNSCFRMMGTEEKSTSLVQSLINSANQTFVLGLSFSASDSFSHSFLSASPPFHPQLLVIRDGRKRYATKTMTMRQKITPRT